MKPTRPAGDPSRLIRRPAIHPGQTTGSETRAAFGRRSIPAKQPAKPARRSAGDPPGQTRRCAPLMKPARLVSRAPRRPRRSRGFHHRLFTASLRAAHRCVSVEIHRYSSLTRLVSRAPRRSRRSRHFAHRLLGDSGGTLLPCYRFGGPQGTDAEGNVGTDDPRRALEEQTHRVTGPGQNRTPDPRERRKSVRDRPGTTHGVFRGAALESPPPLRDRHPTGSATSGSSGIRRGSTSW